MGISAQMVETGAKTDYTLVEIPYMTHYNFFSKLPQNINLFFSNYILELLDSKAWYSRL